VTGPTCSASPVSVCDTLVVSGPNDSTLEALVEVAPLRARDAGRRDLAAAMVFAVFVRIRLIRVPAARDRVAEDGLAGRQAPPAR
jgi:hypothetical protein